MNKSQHQLRMHKILTAAFADKDLSQLIAFKGGTSLMFFHGLPRFSVDLDFNILDVSQTALVYEKMRNIVLQHGRIKDEQMKLFGPIIVLDYEKGANNLKVELSTRCYNNHYEKKFLAGTAVQVMVKPDMFAHKLCALLDRRSGMTGRDVFDLHFFLSHAEAIHQGIVEQRVGKPMAEYIDDCIAALQKADIKALMANVGELLEGEQKEKMRSGKLVAETAQMLEAFKLYPVIAQYPEREFPSLNVSTFTNPQGEHVLVANIGEGRFADRIITAHEQAQLSALPKEEDRHNFLQNLAAAAYYTPWKQQAHREGRGRTR